MKAFIIGASAGALLSSLALAQPATTTPTHPAGTLATAPLTTLTAIPKGNHYVCYPVKAEQFKERKVTFKDQFGVWTMVIVKPTTLCTPAEKRADNKVFEMVDPKLHLMCYQVRYESKAPPYVQVTDQFGTSKMGLYQATTVCLPANKTVTK